MVVDEAGHDDPAPVAAGAGPRVHPSAQAESSGQPTDGEGVDVVFDNGAESTFRASTKVLRRKGLLPYYGAMIGAVPVMHVHELPRSIKVSYPVFRDHIPPARRCCATARTPSTWSGQGPLHPGIGRRHPLQDAAPAETAGRETVTSAHPTWLDRARSAPARIRTRRHAERW